MNFSESSPSSSPDLERPPGPRQNQCLGIRLEAQIIQVSLVQAREYRHCEDPNAVVRTTGSFQNRVVAMHGGETDLVPVQLTDGRRDRLGDVEELQVHEYLLAPLVEPVDQLEVPPGHEQLQAEFVELHRVAELRDQLPGLARRGNIERQDQSLVRGDPLRREGRWVGHPKAPERSSP
jgi:hypothetical protein